MRFEFLIILLTSFTIGFGNAQNMHLAHLKSADSLFAIEKYTQALELYENLHSAQQVSAAMLLKMAYINEALGKYESASFYLLQYHKLTNSDKAFDKVQDIAKKNNLIGYQSQDLEMIENWYFKYQQFIQVLLLVIALLLLLSNGFIRLKKKKAISKTLIGIQLIVLLLVVMATNVERPQRALLNSNNNYLRTSPSAAADVLHILGAGHQVKVIERGDIWSKIKLEDEVCYVRTIHLRMI
jgi:tetratricopeptide (TPR) repeat protein